MEEERAIFFGGRAFYKEIGDQWVMPAEMR
jgi:hypothetical protein